jgi:hypothetical protein
LLLLDEGCYKKDVLIQAVGVIEDTKGKSKVHNAFSRSSSPSAKLNSPHFSGEEAEGHDVGRGESVGL